MTIHTRLIARPSLPVAWCPDADTRDNVVARRNVLAALWAGRLMGLSGSAMSAYAVELHLADYELAGDADVVGKIATDLNRKGLPIPEGVVREKLGQFHREALTQLGATD
jgi:hypothetical protein